MCGEDCGGVGGQCQVFPESPPPVDSISAPFVIEHYSITVKRKEIDIINLEGYFQKSISLHGT